MPVWLLPWMINNYKQLFLLALIAGIGGYIWYLRADVKNHQVQAKTLEQSIVYLKTDVETAKSAISAIDNGFKQYQKYVQASFDSVRETQGKIAIENIKLRKKLDNLVVAATVAGRIEDAPDIPFFMSDPIISIDNGVHRYRLRAPTN